MLVCRNAERVSGQRKVGNPSPRERELNDYINFTVIKITLNG